MTIDEAIKVAEANAELYSSFEGWGQAVSFYDTCAAMLKVMKKMIEEGRPEDAPDAWQERMKREYHETKERYEKLNRLLVKHAAGTLDFTLKCPIELLKAQREHMSDYLYTLEIRAEIEGVNLYD